MIHSNNYMNLLALVAMCIVAAASRVLPHPPNMTAIMAIALFAGARYNNKLLAFCFPLLIMLISDLFIGFHSSQLVVYGCIALVTFLGMSLRNSSSIGKALGMSLVGSTIFFVATNFAVWALGSMYPLTLEGLLLCYSAALPFFNTDGFQFMNSSQLIFGSFFANAIVGDLLFTGVLFGVYELAKKYSFKPTTR